MRHHYSANTLPQCPVLAQAPLALKAASEDWSSRHTSALVRLTVLGLRRPVRAAALHFTLCCRAPHWCHHMHVARVRRMDTVWVCGGFGVLADSIAAGIVLPAVWVYPQQRNGSDMVSRAGAVLKRQAGLDADGTRAKVKIHTVRLPLWRAEPPCCALCVRRGPGGGVPCRVADAACCAVSGWSLACTALQPLWNTCLSVGAPGIERRRTPGRALANARYDAAAGLPHVLAQRVRAVPHAMASWCGGALRPIPRLTRWRGTFCRVPTACVIALVVCRSRCDWCCARDGLRRRHSTARGGATTTPVA